MFVRSWVLAVLVLSSSVSLAFGQSPPVLGVLLLAHGGQPQWNERVTAVARVIDQRHPTEVAFGMASRASIQGALDRLARRGATTVVAVPLFVSSHSSVITSTEFLLGLRPVAPSDLKLFAKMDHGSHGASVDGRGSHDAAADPESPVSVQLPVRMTAALNSHPLIGQVVTDRALSISTSPAGEAVILVAHGPVPDEDNRRWLEDMAVLAGQVRTAAPFASVDYMTVRDDAGPAIKDAATKELRSKVAAQRALGRRVLVVPHLLSFGGIEQRLRQRLEGLDYTMTAQALMPDDRITQWVLASLR
ncbi:MAG: CbiX/SirB N-terminal domain-containing protein [Vicinamibacterales bacterium]|jgi:sirohydrochlorin ferrochelatase